MLIVGNHPLFSDAKVAISDKTYLVAKKHLFKYNLLKIKSYNFNFH